MEHTAAVIAFLLCATAVVEAAGHALDVCASCNANATCDDKTDGFGKVCNCKYGFVGNGLTLCEDKDECQTGSVNICGHHTICHNTFGSYYCTCLSGYRPTNNMATFIPNDGTHCKDIDECENYSRCGRGAICRNMEGSFRCHCQRGHKVDNGRDSFHPFRDNTSCKAVECGRPVLAQDAGLFSVTRTTYGGLAMFKCDYGFVWKRGDIASVCGANGLWTRPTLVCEEVDCGPPPARPHSQMQWDNTSKMDSKVFYHCNSGYHSMGLRNVFYCNRAGQWDVPSVLCKEITCEKPPVVEYTVQVWDGNSTSGSSVGYNCKAGFYNSGGQNISICKENGQWTTPTLLCREIVCGDPFWPLHTERVWRGSSTPGSTVTYYCKTGFYYNKGSNVSLCTMNGYWTKPNILCKEINCGAPHVIPHSVMQWDGLSKLGSKVVYQCSSGYRSVRNESGSVCRENGEWEKMSLICQEIHCGKPVDKPNAKMLWDGTAHVGSVVYYQCNEGYYTQSLKKASICRDNGLWEDPDLWCKEIRCGPPPTVPHTNLLWDGSTKPGSGVRYKCMEEFYPESAVSTCSKTGEWGEVSLICKAKCGSVPFLAHSEVVWHNRSVVIHRCVDRYHSWTGTNTSVCDNSGIWLKATIKCIEIKPPVSQLHVLNERCLHWKAEKYEQAAEVYKVSFTGSRDYQASFHDKGRRSLSSKADHLEVCLNLLPVTNYSISVTAVSAGFTASVYTNTSLPVPKAPEIYYREFETPVPTLSLRRSPDTLDPISVYQVFVLPVEGLMVFDCSSPASSESQSSTSYITAKVDVKDIGTELNFTVGDGLYYKGFFNAPLENGKDYYIIVRAVGEWKEVSKSACVLWGKVKGSSYVLRVSSLSAVASVGLVAMTFLGGYRFFKKT